MTSAWASPASPATRASPDRTLTLIDEPGLRKPETRAVGATCGGIRVWSLYAPNGRTPESAHYAYKLEWFAALRTALEAELGQRVPAGGVRRLQRGADRRRRVGPGGVRRLHPRHAARTAGPGRPARARAAPTWCPSPMKGPHPFTYWDYRAGAFAKDNGMRIDLVYATEAVATRVRRRVRGPRGPQGQGAVRPRADRGGPRARGPARAPRCRAAPRSSPRRAGPAPRARTGTARA